MFDIKINIMDNVDLDIINSIEEKCFKGESLSQNELDYYLNYVVYQTRKILALNRQKDINSYNFNFMCDLAQSIIARYFEKLKISYKPVETGKAITSDILGHSFLIADFNLDDDNKSYIIDPTYNQFFDVSKCAENNFKVIVKMDYGQGTFSIIPCSDLTTEEFTSKTYSQSVSLNLYNVYEYQI